MRSAFVLMPRPKLSDVIDPAKCAPAKTVEERVAILQQMYDEYERRTGASCGPVQHGCFGYSGAHKLGLRSTAESKLAYARGAHRVISIGECRRRGPECCTRLNYAYFVSGPSNKKHSQGTVQPQTSTGEVYSYCYEPFVQQSGDCEVEASNYNPMQCLFHVSYKMEGKAGARIRVDNLQAISDALGQLAARPAGWVGKRPRAASVEVAATRRVAIGRIYFH